MFERKFNKDEGSGKKAFRCWKKVLKFPSDARASEIQLVIDFRLLLKCECVIKLFNVFLSSQLVGLGLFAFSIWIRVEPGFEEWVRILDIYSYYIGVYMLIGVSVLVLITSFIGCCSALMEHGVALMIVSSKLENFIELSGEKGYR